MLHVRAGTGLCSVVIPTRNEGAMLAQTVVSVLEDGAYPRLEVVVDDGSTDRADRRDVADTRACTIGQSRCKPVSSS